jgi:hypothetical protein
MTAIERDCLCEIAFAMEDWLDQFSDLERDFSEREIGVWFPERSYVIETMHYLEGILWKV